jgi:enoyl-CoA hydratase/carnithine racemase
MLEVTRTPSALEICLADPARRNALGRELFFAIESALDAADAEERRWASALASPRCAIHRPAADGAAAGRAVEMAGEGRGEEPPVPPPPIILCGAGQAFCAGFDLESAITDPRGPAPLMKEYLSRLSGILRRLRRHPAPVIAAVHGAALAGGCALLSACDFVIVAPDAILGYPVHRLGVSPAVASPTLAASIGPGAARALLLSGALRSGRDAAALGLATAVAESAETVRAEAAALAARLAAKGPQALRATKAWLTELDGSAEEPVLLAALEASIRVADGSEARRMLEAFWSHRRSGPPL